MGFFKSMRDLFSTRPTPNSLFLNRLNAGTLPRQEMRQAAQRKVEEEADKLRSQYTEHDTEAK